jgi:hypothetical protein
MPERRGSDETPRRATVREEDATLLNRIRIAGLRKPLRVGLAEPSGTTGGNIERGSPGDEPGGVRRQEKALKGLNPKSGSGMKQGRKAR